MTLGHLQRSVRCAHDSPLAAARALAAEKGATVLRQACPEQGRRAQHERKAFNDYNPIPFTLSLSKGEHAGLSAAR